MAQNSSKIEFEKATFALGCFWCAEAAFRVLGVEKVISGYAGGTVESPSYEEVSTGRTGHMEAIQVEYDPAKVSYEDLLGVFWVVHDPTQENGQGPDIGPQYRAAVFFHNEQQKELAEESKKKLEESGKYDKPIVTQIRAFQNFYPAEEYHQEYYKKHPDDPYVQNIVAKKVEKAKKAKEALRESKERFYNL